METAGRSAGGSDQAGAAGSSGRCTGKLGQHQGKSNQTVSAGGLTRTFVYYAPADLDPNTPAPVVIVAHGWTMSGQEMFDITQYSRIADREGFVVVFPDGEPGSVGPWNVGQNACPSTLLVLPLGAGDDQAFVDAMLEFAEADRCLDRDHVFMTGFSMGGYFSNETGCLRPDIAAIAPHSGGSHDLASCASSRKPTIIFHGTTDGLIPVTCGREARDRWAARNGCGTEVESRAVMGGTCEFSRDCPPDGQVALCLFEGMAHGWAGGIGSANAFPEYESASELGWEFFTTYGW
jgi:polyhydroxybutyrate depolymerase